MKAALRLEYIGESFAAQERIYSWKLSAASGGNDNCDVANVRKPWVAEITAFGGKFGVERNFLPSTVQRQRASGTGNRGVELWFICESGKVYQAQHFLSWRHKERFFFVVTDAGAVEKVTEEWARNFLASTFLPQPGSA